MLVAVALSCLVGEAAAEPAAILSNKRKDERVQEIRTLRKGGETVPTIIERTGFSKASFGDHQALAGTWGQRSRSRCQDRGGTNARLGGLLPLTF